jgi:hypothetical protein
MAQTVDLAEASRKCMRVYYCNEKVFSMARNKICGECGGEMHAGFIMGNEGGADVPQGAAYWLEGPYKKGFFGLKTGEKKIYYILAYRCEQCGFLKFYAGPDQTTETKE